MGYIQLRNCQEDGRIAYCNGECFECDRIDHSSEENFTLEESSTEEEKDWDKTTVLASEKATIEPPLTRNNWWKDANKWLDENDTVDCAWAPPTNNDDKVNHPSHYNTGKYEVIDIIKDKMTTEQYYGFLCGNVIKYITRWQNKNGLEDLKKARWYLEKLIEEKENE